MGENTWIECSCHQESIRVKASQKFVPFLLFPKHFTSAAVGDSVVFWGNLSHHRIILWQNCQYLKKQFPASFPHEMWSWEALLGFCRLCRWLEGSKSTNSSLKIWAINQAEINSCLKCCTWDKHMELSKWAGTQHPRNTSVLDGKCSIRIFLEL